MPQLNQVIAIEKGVKARTDSAVATAQTRIRTPALFSGISRTYRPKDEDGVVQPPEIKHVQLRVDDVLDEVSKALIELIDVTATKDYANTEAVADVVVDGDRTLLTAVPVTHLLFLEKVLYGVCNLIRDLPTPDPAKNWTYDETAGSLVSDAEERTSSKKVPRAHVLYEATPEHPAQVQTYPEDVVVGFWTTKLFSGAITADRRQDMLRRVERLQDAVKQAREQANMVAAPRQTIGAELLSYILRGAST